MQRLLGAIFLIVGTSVGAGMLGLPVETGQSGFFPSILAMFFIWIVTTISALLLAEVVVRSPKGSNFFSMSERYFGSIARGATLIVYFLLFFSLVTAYVKGGGMFLTDQFLLSATWQGSLIFLAAFIPFIFLGTFFVEKLNFAITIALFICYTILVAVGIKYVNPEMLETYSFPSSFFSLPLIITAFSYHGTLPTIVHYLQQDIKKIRTAIFIGSSITFLIYLTWQYLILGIIPLSGEFSLSSALQADKTAMLYLKNITGSSLVGKWGSGFSFAALATSFLGVSIGIVDFFLDALKLKRKPAHRLAVSLVIFSPAFIISMAKVPIFYFSLKYGAGFACIFLLIFLPAAMNRKSTRNTDSIFQSYRLKVIHFVYCITVITLISTFWDLFR